MSVDLRDVINLVCLVYHEGRNARHVIKAGRLSDASKYAGLVSLPHNRDDAWRSMGKLRSRAAESGSIGAAIKTFERAFGLRLVDLAALYEMPIWKHSAAAYGGNKWAGISSKVCDLVSAMEAGDASSMVEELYRDALGMAHNTGRVADKLRRLESS